MPVASANGRARWLGTDGKDVCEGLAALRRLRRLQERAPRAAGAASAAPTRTEEPSTSPSPARTTPRTTSQLNSRAVCMCNMGNTGPQYLTSTRGDADPRRTRDLDAVATAISRRCRRRPNGAVTIVGLVGRPGLYPIALAAPPRLDRRTSPSRLERSDDPLRADWSVVAQSCKTGGCGGCDHSRIIATQGDRDRRDEHEEKGVPEASVAQ